MQKLPQVSGEEIIKLLLSLGYVVVKQRGSHVRLRKVTTFSEHNITVPVHKILAKGTFSDILSRISLWNNITKEELLLKL